MIKARVFALLWVAFTSGALPAELPIWRPSPGHAQVPIWPDGRMPDAAPALGPETAADGGKPVAGRPWVAVTDVSTPTMTVYRPAGKNTGAAAVVFPGGGYKVLAMDLEGTEVADWLTSRGITCVLLKYRVPFSGPYLDEARDRMVYPDAPRALQDAQRTVSLVRSRAADWGVDPRKVGVLGFSAGGHVAAGVSTRFNDRAYAAVDDADRQSCRPDFAVLVFPGHLWDDEDRDPPGNGDGRFALKLRSDVRPGRETPPTFLLMAEDDHVDGVEQALTYYLALKHAGVPVEMHLYAQGGHAFGLRPTKDPITRWPGLVEKWLDTIGMISSEPGAKADGGD